MILCSSPAATHGLQWYIRMRISVFVLLKIVRLSYISVWSHMSLRGVDTIELSDTHYRLSAESG